MHIADSVRSLCGQSVCSRIECDALRGVHDRLEDASSLVGIGHVERILVLVDEQVEEIHRAVSRSGLLTTGSDCRVCLQSKTNPSTDDAKEVFDQVLSYSPDIVVSIGGGSTIDVAKIGSLAVSGYAYGDIIEMGSLPHGTKAIPILAVPTTAGTGSEATQFAAVYHKGAKQSVDADCIRPCSVILDASLLAAAPREILAAPALDALCQGIESVWAISATQESLIYAFRGIELMRGVFPSKLASSTSDLYMQMLVGAYLSGRAIQITRTTAAHALSYRLTSHHGMIHGHVVALLIGAVMEFNANCQDDNIRERIRLVLSVLGFDVREFRAWIRTVLESLGLSPDLRSAGVLESSLQDIARSVNTQRLQNNPLKMTHQDLLSVLHASWDTSRELTSTRADNGSARSSVSD